MFSEEHACFWKNTHGSGKDKRVSVKTRMVAGKTSVFLEKHAWFGKDKRVSEKTRMVPGKTGMFPEEQTATLCFPRKRTPLRISSSRAPCLGAAPLPASSSTRHG